MLHGHPFRVNATKFPRRRFLHLATGAAVLSGVSRIARAQTYPTRPVRLVVAAPPGGVQDITARLTAQWLSERLGRPFIISSTPSLLCRPHLPSRCARMASWIRFCTRSSPWPRECQWWEPFEGTGRRMDEI
jgi:hypothetical protein